MQEIGRSGIFLSAVSNRLAASSTRARFLGMTVGTAISELIEQPGKGMKFDLLEMNSEEATWYLGLIKRKDTMGSLDSLRYPDKLTPQKPTTKRAEKPKAPAQKQGNQPRSKIVAIEEINESENEEDEEDEDLIPYEKPDDDLSDDDEDPTLVQRNKPTPPVSVMSNSLPVNLDSTNTSPDTFAIS